MSARTTRGVRSLAPCYAGEAAGCLPPRRREVRRTHRAPFPSLRHQLRTAIARLVWLGALLGLLACPLTYKGGAELPHAHALFQLLFDAAHGSIDHHHDGDAADDDDAPPQITAHLPSLGALTGSRVSPMTESADGLSLALALAAGWWRGRGGGALAAGNSRRLTGQHPAPDPPPPRRSPAVF